MTNTTTRNLTAMIAEGPTPAEVPNRTVTVAGITPQQYWKHGYRWGYDDALAGLRRMVDDEDAAEVATVIPFPREVKA